MKILIVRTETELAEMLSQLEKADTYCLDTETLDRGLFDLSLVGLSLSLMERGFYVPTGHAESRSVASRTRAGEDEADSGGRRRCVCFNAVRPQSSEGVRWGNFRRMPGYLFEGRGLRFMIRW